ncbi:MAG TPA: GNAT family N-acetyltransferase [Acidimicrobiia bacterium]|nr:GNAT family N-acetyltransferase [Acidimicrobiia bacterium]
MTTWSRGEYLVTTDPARVDLEVVQGFLANDSYWAQGRTRDDQARANAASRCYSLIHEPTGSQVGFARAVTDGVTFAWIADVFVVEAHRGYGLGKFLVECFTDDLTAVYRLFLGTRDAHGLYSPFGFVAGERTERWMERLR